MQGLMRNHCWLLLVVAVFAICDLRCSDRSQKVQKILLLLVVAAVVVNNSNLVVGCCC